MDLFRRGELDHATTRFAPAVCPGRLPYAQWLSVLTSAITVCDLRFAFRGDAVHGGAVFPLLASVIVSFGLFQDICLMDC